MAELRDFLYLDRAKLYSFVSQISGGITSEITEKTRQQGIYDGNTGLSNSPYNKIGGLAKFNETEYEQTIEVTPFRYFGVLYDHLVEQDNIKQLDSTPRSDLKTRQFVESQGLLEPPAVDGWINRFKTLWEFYERNLKVLAPTQSQNTRSSKKNNKPLQDLQLKQFRQLFNVLLDFIDISRQEQNKIFVRMKLNSYNVWCGLVPEFVIAPLQSELPADVTILGRVEKLMQENEVWKIIDFSLFDQSSQAGKLLEVLNGVSLNMGRRQISEGDLQANFPDIIITPLAIYR